MLGIIRVLTTENEDVLYEHGKLIESYVDLPTTTLCIDDQPSGIYDEATEAIAVPKIVKLAKKMATEHKCSALTISCADDPALEETRNVVNIPVLGAGTCGAHAASMVGNRIGIIGIRDTPPPNMVRELGNKLHSYSFATSVRKTTDLFLDKAKEDLYKVVTDVIDSGADTILFACTGFSTIHFKNYLQERTNIPVIDLVEAQAIGYQLIGKK